MTVAVAAVVAVVDVVAVAGVVVAAAVLVSAASCLRPSQLARTLLRPAARSQVFFELMTALEDSTLSLGDSGSGVACCSMYKYYVFPAGSKRVHVLGASCR